MHRLKLLGGASIDGPEGPLGGAIAQRQRLAFLAVLSTAPTGLVSRDKLLALLWPELDPGRARRALSNALYVIKKELGEESISAVGDDLRLDVGSVSVDVLEFEAAADSGELERAASLYAGPFLEGIHVREAPDFERWADGERDRLAALHADVLERLANSAADEGRLTDAAEWWRKLAVLDPYSTRVALAFMEALSGAGDRAGALRHAQVHTTLLREEFGAEPDPALIELAERMKKEGPPAVFEGTSASAGDAAAERPHLPPVPDVPPPPSPGTAGVPASRPLIDGGEAATAEASGGPRAIFDGVVQRIGRQRLVQWGLAYLAGAWFLLQALDVFAEAWGLSPEFQRTVFILLFFGFLLTLVLVWYHGEKGRQRITGPELLIIAALLVIAGGVLTMVGPSGEGDPSALESLAPPVEGDDRLTVAVLPFESFSPSREDDYFADGMHEEILSKLSRISSLRVISRSSVMQFRESRPAVAQMAGQLGADFLLEGSARIAGGLVRLTAQLIDARSDEHVWSAEFDQPLSLDSLLTVQGRIADSVASRMEATLSPEEREEIATRPTDNLEAYDLYLHGRFLWNRRTAPDMRQALELFQQAIALDSLYAYAYAGLADVYLTLQSWDFLSFDEAIPQAEQALQRALHLNPLMGEAHTSLGTVLESRGDIPGAIASFTRGLELAPDHATGHHWFSLLLARQRFFDDALTHIRYARGVDPLSRMIAANTGWILHLSRDHEGAVRELEALTGREPGFAFGWYLLGEAYTMLGRHEEALNATGRSVELDPWPNSLLGLAWVHAMAGNEEEARAILERRFDRSDALRRAQVHVALGENDRALELVEEGIRTRSPYLGELNVEPQWDPIRDDPRFQEILRRLGFPE